MRRNGRSGARVAVAVFAALLGIALGTTSTAAREQPAAAARAGGTICISLEWAMTPTRSEAGFVLANRGNTVWRGVFLPTAGGHGMVCEADLPADRYLVCEVAYGGYDIQLLPAPGQTAYESCIGLTLADGETGTTAFRNVPPAPAATSEAIGTVRAHPLQVPGPILHGEPIR
jgi:hypothetical protein